MILSVAAATANAADLGRVTESAKSDLEVALADLAALRKQIEQERIPLSQRLHALEEETLAKRRELERARRSQENELVELNALKAEVKRRGDEIRFVEALLGEYLRTFETRIHIAETPRYKDVVDAAKVAALSSELAPAEKLATQAALVEAALARLESVIGGELFEGRALSPQGRLERGHYALIGPLALFASDESETAGVAQLQLGSPEPTVLALPEEFDSAIRSVADSGTGGMPLDATMGTALKLGATRDTFLQHMMKGGPVMVPIVLLGVFALLVFVSRWLVIGRIRIATPQDLQVILGALRKSDRTKATAHASGIHGPVGEMLHLAIDHCRERKECIEEVMYEKMIATKPKLEKLLPFLALSAAAAPLLGLLGTVTGMINTFNMITVFGTGDPKTLAGGISEALITTEYGLIVAIPSLLLHAILSRRVKGVLASMEQTAVAFINGLPSQSEEALYLKKGEV